MYKFPYRHAATLGKFSELSYVSDDRTVRRDPSKSPAQTVCMLR